MKRMLLLLSVLILLPIIACDASSKVALSDSDIQVRYYKTAIVMITNSSDKDWNKVALTLNDKYVYSCDVIASKKIFNVSMNDFSDKNGQRFNFDTMKPLSLNLTCKLPGGNTGYYHGTWD